MQNASVNIEDVFADFADLINLNDQQRGALESIIVPALQYGISVDANGKPAISSRTMIINGIVVVAGAALLIPQVRAIIPVEAYPFVVMGLAVLNMVLRRGTKGAITSVFPLPPDAPPTIHPIQ